jgi:perosamine synthetase
MISLFETIITPKAKQLVNEVLDSTFLNQGPIVDKFEAALTEQLHFKNPISLNSCTSSLFLALKLAGVELGDKVIIPPQTFVATGLAVLSVGAIPVFCDVDLNGNISLEDLQNCVTKNTKAVIVVHWGGFPADLKPIYEFCSANNIKVIEDAAHALGAEYLDTYIGDCTYSDYCCFSLQAIKALTSGDGGVLCCRNNYDRIRAEKLRWFGIDKKNIVRNENGERAFDITEIGYKLHMNDLTAAIGLGNLEGLENRLKIKEFHATAYDWSFRMTDNLQTAYAKYSCKPSNWLYTIKVKNRNRLIKKLKDNGIQASTVDTRIDKYTIFKGPYELPKQEWFEATQVSIPCTSSLTIDEQVKITHLINEGW